MPYNFDIFDVIISILRASPAISFAIVLTLFILTQSDMYLFLVVLIFSGYIIQAQVQENMLMERFNMNAFNPAYVGSEGREVSFTTRSFWQGIAGSPKTSYFFYSGNPKRTYHSVLQLFPIKYL